MIIRGTIIIRGMMADMTNVTPQWMAVLTMATNIRHHVTATGGGVDIEMAQEMLMLTSFGL